MGIDWYRLHWYVDYKYRRILYPRHYSRDTDEAGARRFIAKWSPWKIPEELKPLTNAQPQDRITP